MAEIELTVTGPGPGVDLTVGDPFVPPPRLYTPAFDALGTSPTYTLMAEDHIAFGKKASGRYTRLGPIVFFKQRLITGSFIDTFDDGDGYLVIDLPVAPDEQPGLNGSGYIACYDTETSIVEKWSVDLVLDPIDLYDHERPLLARTGRTNFNPADVDDGAADPPPTYLTSDYRPAGDGLFIIVAKGWYFAA